MPEPHFVDGIGAIADRYAAFVLDQWGVLHDGHQLYPGVAATLLELQRRAKKLVILSNSARRLAHNNAMLRRLGLDPGMFDAVITSGETAWNLLAAGGRPPFDRLGRRCALVTREGDLEVVAGTGVEVAAVEQADFLFLAGVDSPELGMADYLPTLETAAARGLPCICSNPDRYAPSGSGIVLAPGELALRYQELGGEVTFIGKPHPLVYGAVLDALDGLHGHEILAVGDSLEHDIGGANRAGLHSAFVSLGLHAADFPREAGLGHNRAQLERLSAEIGARPEWVVPRFAW